MSILSGERFARAFVYWTGLINTFWNPILDAILIIRNPDEEAAYLSILAFPISLILWRKVIQRNKQAIRIQIAILATLIAISAIYIFRVLHLVHSYSLFMLIGLLAFITWWFFLLLGVAPGFIIITMFWVPKFIYVPLYWEYWELLIDPLTLTLSIIFLIVIMYWRRYE